MNSRLPPHIEPMPRRASSYVARGFLVFAVGLWLIASYFFAYFTKSVLVGVSFAVVLFYTALHVSLLLRRHNRLIFDLERKRRSFYRPFRRRNRRTKV